jgi:dTDP-4-amino-4,6-dideoxygalactose transaminase
MIPLAKPVLGKAEERAVTRVMRSRMISQGKEVLRLEKEVSRRFGRHAVAVSSGGAGLLLALKALGVSKGDEVIVPDFTFPAGAMACMWLDATPVPADVEEEGLGIDPDEVKRLITRKTKAVVVVHQLGIPARIEEIRRICDDRGIALLEDAACAFGGKTRSGQMAGTIGDISVFSLHPRKIVTSGEGGLVLCDQKHLQNLLSLRNYGRKGMGFEARFEEVGLNFRMSDILAAVALENLKRLEKKIERRKRIFGWFIRALQGIEGVQIPKGYFLDGCTYQTLAVRIKGGAKRVSELLSTKGIQCGPAAYSLVSQKVFEDRFGNKRIEVSEMLAFELIALPFYEEMTRKEVLTVTKSLKETLPERGVQRWNM